MTCQLSRKKSIQSLFQTLRLHDRAKHTHILLVIFQLLPQHQQENQLAVFIHHSTTLAKNRTAITRTTTILFSGHKTSIGRKKLSLNSDHDLRCHFQGILYLEKFEVLLGNSTFEIIMSKYLLTNNTSFQESDVYNLY